MAINIHEGIEIIIEGQEKILELLRSLREPASHEKLYDMEDIAEILDVSRRTIATWTKQGILPYIKVGNKLWVTEDQLKCFLQENSSDALNQLMRKG